MPLYLDEFFHLDAASYDLFFMDAEVGPRLMSYGLRAMQDYFLNDFVEGSGACAIDEIVAPEYAPKMHDIVVSCKEHVLEVLHAIDRQQAYETDELPKRRAAAEVAASKILAHKQDEARKQSVNKWLNGELDRLSQKAKDLEASAGQAAARAGCSLHKLLNMLKQHDAFAVEFSDKLELWHQMDATQKAAYKVMAGGEVPTEPLVETQPDDSNEVSHDDLANDVELATQRDDYIEDVPVDVTMSETQRMISQSSKNWEYEELQETLREDPYGDQTMAADAEDMQDHSIREQTTEGPAIPDSEKAQSGEGGHERATEAEGGQEQLVITDSNKAQSGEGPSNASNSEKAQSGEGGHDSKKAQSGEGGHDSEKAQSGEGPGNASISEKAQSQSGEGVLDSEKAQSGEGPGNDSEKAQSQSGEGGHDSEKAQSGEGGHDSTSKPVGSGTVDMQGTYDYLHELAMNDTDKNQDDQASDAGSVEILNDDALIEAELARLILKARLEFIPLFDWGLRVWEFRA